jgi:outer membrane receptor protein involved in Fe transport
LRVVVCLIVIELLAGAGPVCGGTTGQLIGFVTTDLGDPLPGVAVVASSPAQIGPPLSTLTDEQGQFAYPRLAPGFYVLDLTVSGFAAQRLTEVQVRVDRTAQIRATLQNATFSETVEVVETTPVVDPVQVSIAQTFTPKYIRETASHWESLITQSAATSPHNFRRMLGSTPQDNAYLLDGLDATNWYQRHPNLATENLPFDAIQEMSLQSAGYEAEFGQASGGVINVVTKSGGNDFHGTLDLRYTDSSLETSGDHYDPEEQISNHRSASATLGGPILRDRLWFFGSASLLREQRTPYQAPTTETDENGIFLGKLTWQPNATWSVIGKAVASPMSQANQLSSQFRAEEASRDQEDDSAIASLEGVGILSDAMLWSAKLGYKGWNQTILPASGDLSTIGHSNRATGEYYGNYGYQWYAETFQYELATDLTWFLDGAVGSHEVKAGLSYGEPEITEQECYNGGGRCAKGVEGFYFRDTVDDSGLNHPYQMNVRADEGELRFGAQYTAAFVQDSWRLRPDLNLKLGLRWDHVRYSNNADQRIADLERLQPRVGLAWDVTGKGRSILRASWGRFMHPGGLIMSELTAVSSYPTEYWRSCSAAGLADPDECALAAADVGFGHRTDPEGWDPAGWWLDPANVVQTAPNQTDPGLRPGYNDEWLISFEQQLFRRTSLELSYLNKAGRDFSDDTCNGNIPERDPDGACDYYIISNLPEIRSDYEGWILRIESSGVDWLHLLASWTISSSKGSLDYNTAATGSFDYYPYHFANRYGYLPDQSRHRVKINGYVLLPYDFSIGFVGWWDSEMRWTPYDSTVPGIPYGSVYVEPRGNRRADGRHRLDLQFGKGFRVGPTRLQVLARVINATNSQQATGICGSVTGCGAYDMGDATAWQQPRRYELGARVEF